MFSIWILTSLYILLIQHGDNRWQRYSSFSFTLLFCFFVFYFSLHTFYYTFRDVYHFDKYRHRKMIPVSLFFLTFCSFVCPFILHFVVAVYMYKVSGSNSEMLLRWLRMKKKKSWCDFLLHLLVSHKFQPHHSTISLTIWVCWSRAHFAFYFIV